jgi:hypothetical protein
MGFLSYLLRDETFAHGLYGDRPKPNDRLLSGEAFEKIRDVMLTRYADGGLDAILKERNATTMLYAWSQAGGRKDIIERVSVFTADDHSLMAFLKRLYGANSSLSLEALRNFFDSPVNVVRRVMRLAAVEQAFPGASETLDAVKASIHFDGGDFASVISQWEDREREDSQVGDEIGVTGYD